MLLDWKNSCKISPKLHLHLLALLALVSCLRGIGRNACQFIPHVILVRHDKQFIKDQDCLTISIIVRFCYSSSNINETMLIRRVFARNQKIWQKKSSYIHNIAISRSTWSERCTKCQVSWSPYHRYRKIYDDKTEKIVSNRIKHEVYMRERKFIAGK